MLTLVLFRWKVVQGFLGAFDPTAAGQTPRLRGALGESNTLSVKEKAIRCSCMDSIDEKWGGRKRWFRERVEKCWMILKVEGEGGKKRDTKYWRKLKEIWIREPSEKYSMNQSIYQAFACVSNWLFRVFGLFAVFANWLWLLSCKYCRVKASAFWLDKAWFLNHSCGEQCDVTTDISILNSIWFLTSRRKPKKNHKSFEKKPFKNFTWFLLY
jgi:hypothetical protein